MPSRVAEAPPIVWMIPSAFTGPWLFAEWRAGFEKRGYEVRIISLPRPARTADIGSDPTGFGLMTYADYLSAQIVHATERPILVGHGLGGLLAQLLAARNLASGLILLAPAPSWGLLPQSAGEMAFARTLMAQGDFRNAMVVPDFTFASTCSLRHLPTAQRLNIFKRLVPESGRALFETWFWMFDASRASYVDAIDLTCPTLFLCGSEDPLVSPALCKRAADRFAAVSTFMEISAHGHMLTLEPGSDAIMNRCLDWLKLC